MILIKGYASVFDEVDLLGDKVAPGAFARCLSRGRQVYMRYRHEIEHVGEWTEIREDDRGLYVEGKVFENSPTSRLVCSLVRHGALGGLSIGFRTIEWEGGAWLDYKRRLLEVDLLEISLVPYPALQSATLEVVSDTPRSFWKDLVKSIDVLVTGREERLA